MRALTQSFFDRSTVKVARDLLGCFLVRRLKEKTTRYMIIETEAYDGHEDMASHASHGITSRNSAMFGPAGYWYIYLVYGMHLMLNIVTCPEDYPAAVLIRGIIDQNGRCNLKGPGKLTKYLKIRSSMNGKKCARKSGLWMEARKMKVTSKMIRKSARVGVDYAGPIWSKKEWRFILHCTPTRNRTWTANFGGSRSIH